MTHWPIVSVWCSIKLQQVNDPLTHCISLVQYQAAASKWPVDPLYQSGAVSSCSKCSYVCVCTLSMGRNKDIDTTAFRHAIWHYVHCIYGVRHDDYNYGVINDLLEKNVRSFVKLISCFPEKTTLRDYRHFMTEFLQSEKVRNRKYTFLV